MAVISTIGLRGAAFAGLVLLTSGCSTNPLSFEPPQLSANYEPDKTHVSGAVEMARQYSKKYRTAADDLANAPQIFEVPLIAAAAVAAGGLIFGAHPDMALAAGLTAGTITAAGQYYAPRARATIMRQASEAFACVRDAGKQVLFLDHSPTERVPALINNDQSTTSTNAQRARPFNAAAAKFAEIASQARANARMTAISPAAQNPATAANVARQAAGLDVLAAVATEAADVTRKAAVKAADVPKSIVDALEHIRNISQRKIEASSVVPSYGNLTASLKSSQESAYTLAANIRSTRKQFSDAQGMVAPGAGGGGPAPAPAELSMRAAAVTVGLSEDAEQVAKLDAELISCISMAPD